MHTTSTSYETEISNAGVTSHGHNVNKAQATGETCFRKCPYPEPLEVHGPCGLGAADVALDGTGHMPTTAVRRYRMLAVDEHALADGTPQ